MSTFIPAECEQFISSCTTGDINAMLLTVFILGLIIGLGICSHYCKKRMGKK